MGTWDQRLLAFISGLKTGPLMETWDQRISAFISGLKNPDR